MRSRNQPSKRTQLRVPRVFFFLATSTTNELKFSLPNLEKKQRKIALRGTGHYWLLLKMIVGIKTYMGMNKGELVIVLNIAAMAYFKVTYIF